MFNDRLHAGRIGLATAAVVTLAILGFYLSRLAMPLPIFASDEAAYLLRALYPDRVLAAYPSVAQIDNGVRLSVIRAVYDLGVPYIAGDRMADGAAYVGGLLLVWRVGAGPGLARTGDQLSLFGNAAP